MEVTQYDVIHFYDKNMKYRRSLKSGYHKRGEYPKWNADMIALKPGERYISFCYFDAEEDYKDIDCPWCIQLGYNKKFYTDEESGDSDTDNGIKYATE